MTGDELKAFADAHALAWNRHDTDTLCAHHAENGVVSSPMFARMQGRKEICPSYGALFAIFPDFHIEFGSPICEGARVAMPFSVNATHQGEFMGFAGTGRRCQFEGVSLYEIDEHGLIRDERRVYDFTGLLTQLGVLRVKPGR